MQVGGFVVLLLGTLIYNELLKVPYLKYDSADNEGKERLLDPADGASFAGDEEYFAASGIEDSVASVNAINSDTFPVRGIKAGRR